MPNAMRAVSRQILTFLALVFTFSCVPYALMIHTGHIGAGSGMTVRLVMWCPALAAFATCAIHRIDLASLGWSWRPAKYEWIAYLLPFADALPVYIACWLAIPGSFGFGAFAQKMAASYGFGRWPVLSTLGVGLPLLATIGITASLSTALGEEIGWRGFLLPRLTGRFGWFFGCVLSGAIWGLWHYPGLLFADYNASTNKIFALSCFTLMVIGNAFLMGWLRLKSGSLWPCAVLHASHNLLIQAILDSMTAPAGHVLYITTEFGAGMVITNIIVAACLWMQREGLQPGIHDQREILVQNATRLVGKHDADR